MAVTREGLKRSREQRILAGVCGGFAEWLGWNATLVRIGFVLVSALSAAFPGIIVYLILWFLMPNRDEPTP
ncbi:MAG: PspC domain-containing protein [Myxococcales bacterium]|nr:PspC domain-containing protein [Myxococcales bacterium]